MPRFPEFARQTIPLCSHSMAAYLIAQALLKLHCVTDCAKCSFIDRILSDWNCSKVQASESPPRVWEPNITYSEDVTPEFYMHRTPTFTLLM